MSATRPLQGNPGHQADIASWGEGRDDRFAEIAAEFIRLKVDVILTYATSSSLAAKKATAIIPIVFARWRPGRHGPRRFTGATGRQHHRLYRSSKPILPASASKCCARFFRVFARWRSWPISAAQPPCSKCPRLRQRPARSASTWSHRRFDKPRISRPRSRCSRGRADALHVCCRPAYDDQSDMNHHLGAGRATADHARLSGNTRSRRAES